VPPRGYISGRTRAPRKSRSPVSEKSVPKTATKERPSQRSIDDGVVRKVGVNARHHFSFLLRTRPPQRVHPDALSPSRTLARAYRKLTDEPPQRPARRACPPSPAWPPPTPALAFESASAPFRVTRCPWRYVEYGRPCKIADLTQAPIRFQCARHLK
jgi:hypothetical protein